MIFVSASKIAFAFASLFFSIALVAQPILDIAPGQERTGAAGSEVDLYRFSGESGTTIKLVLTAPGSSGLILYTPRGEEMLSARGTGKVTLEAILPLWDSYTVAVVRKRATGPYTLKLDAQEPDDHLALFAHGVGFEFDHTEGKGTYLVSSCWIEPGIKLRRFWPKGTEELTIGRAGKEFGAWQAANGKSGSAERGVTIKDGNVTYRWPDGSQREVTKTFEDIVTTEGLLGYKGYLCGALE